MRIPFDPSIKTALVVTMVIYDRAGQRPSTLRAAVDTGAGTTMIPVAAARSLGYLPSEADSTRIVTASGVLYAPRIVLDRVDVGPASAQGVEAICHDLPRESMLDALVGLSFLTRFGARFDFEAWEMELVPRAG